MEIFGKKNDNMKKLMALYLIHKITNNVCITTENIKRYAAGEESKHSAWLFNYIVFVHIRVYMMESIGKYREKKPWTTKYTYVFYYIFFDMVGVMVVVVEVHLM